MPTLVPRRLRARVVTSLGGDPAGPAPWVRDLENGDDAGHFGPGSATWAVHGGMTPIVAGIRALLLQALHPGAMAGVHDHSRYREDPLGRLGGTIRWIYTVSYGDTAAAARASHMVLAMHDRVRGRYADAAGRPVAYSANDPDLLRWVHLAFTDSFLATAVLWGGAIPGGPDAYVREWATAGELMGIDRAPRSVDELAAAIREYADAGVLRRDGRVDEAVRFIRDPPLPGGAGLGYRALFGGAVISLDDRYRRMLGLEVPRIGRAATAAVAGAALRGIDTILSDRLAGRGRTPSEEAALRRLARLSASRPLD